MCYIFKKTCYIYLLIIILIILQERCHVSSHYNNRYSKLQNIHRSMKKRDLSRIFGVENTNEVPDYEIITPSISNIYSNQLIRMRRNINNNNNDKPINFNFGVSAFDIDFHLNLSLNKHLLGPNFKIEIKGHNGTVREKDSKHCHYIGNVKGHANSVAAVSNCKGLRGLFSTNKHDYFIEPVPDYLHNVHTVDSDMHKPHIIFRRSLENVNMKTETPGDTFSRLWYKDSNVKRSCGTQDDPRVRFERSAEDVSNLVNIDNSEKYMETLVVVDQKMVNYHGEDAATQFALVVLNIVASLLRDGSIGSNLIILVIVKLELHTVDVPGLIINHHARNTLDSFGSWASRASDQDDRSDDHYDYAILLTRYNICADDKQPCDMLGLTQTGGMCNWPYSASVNEDNGLPLAYTVTHSIGHSLGMNHDGDESSYICPDNAYIMSSTITQEWKDTRNLWSRCSRNYLRQFLKKPQSHCLNDLPVKERSVDYQKMDNKPGILYDISKQCEMQFGTGSKVCNKLKSEEICWKLSCTNPLNADKCFTSIYPAADGTPCNQDKWCFRGKCVATGMISSTDGGWASWSDDYSPCSRSCGGGVQFRIRHCNHPKPNNGGKYCEGETRFYRLCNTKACPNTLLTHRNAQCSKLNNRLFGERKFEWEFKPSKIDSCKLGCFISGTGHGYDFGNVEDGTNCDQMDDCIFCDKCINGACVSVGCDGKLGSHAKFDRCGVCDGDGSSCSTGTERSEIPDGNNGGGIVDALKSLKDMGFDMGHLYGHSILDLTSKRSGVPGSKDTNNEFGWARLKSGCSVSCGGGFETVTAECRRQDDGSPVSEDKCDRSLKPPTQQYPCKEDACPPVWQTSYWGDCSKTCNGGYKKRNVRCVQKSGNGIEYDIDGSLCSGTRPTDTEGCNKEPCPAEWIAQPFGECSTICGPGIQVRDVLCQRTLKDGSLQTESENNCRKDVKPPAEQKCNAHNPCPGDAGCGGIYTDSRGNFTSPNYPNDYPNNMECVHIIQVQEGKVIQVDFDKMNIVAADTEDCKNDFVKVMDGDCVSRLGESKFCGKTLPPPFISTTNRLCVKFFSDDSQNDEGFLAKYHAIDKPAQSQDMCGSNITAPAGLISSPNYPEYYPANEDCNITISTEERPIKISFHAFDVGSDDCSTDYVYLSGGEENKKYCGQKVPPAYVSKDPIVVQFISTNHAATLKPGFVATYTSGKTQEAASARSEEMPPLESHKEAPAENHNKTDKDMEDMQKEARKNNNANTAGNQEEKKSMIPHAPIPLQQQLKESIGTIRSEEMPPLESHKEVPAENHNKTDKDMEDLQKEARKNNKPNTGGQQEQKNSMIPPAPISLQPNKPTDFMFVNSNKHNDAVAKEMKENIQDITPEKKAFINAMKDDTPAWIPEAEDYAKRSQITIKPNPQASPITNTAQLRQPVKPLAAAWPHPAQLLKPQPQQQQQQQQQHAVKQVIQQAAPVAYVAQPNENTYAGQLKSIYEHNLDGQRGTCPNSSELKCIRVLLSYPCTSDYNCKSGFACCPTSCTYGTKMCTPKVTRHCPLRDPFYYPRIACRTEGDCPNSSPCCLDMGNQRYCRHMITDTWGK